MRRWLGALAIGVTAGCGATPRSAPSTPPSRSAEQINPAGIKRIGAEFPSGYETAGVTGPSAPTRIWGLGADAASDPARCAALADPLGDSDAAVQGVSGSGSGGIVYAMVVASGAVVLDPARVAECAQWTIRGGGASAGVRQIDAPGIAGAQTFGMASDITTVAEGGNETRSKASTFIAYLGDYYAFTVLVTDPGSPDAALQPAWASDLLVKTVSALRA